jgi:hypothetical protein
VSIYKSIYDLISKSLQKGGLACVCLGRCLSSIVYNIHNFLKVINGIYMEIQEKGRGVKVQMARSLDLSISFSLRGDMWFLSVVRVHVQSMVVGSLAFSVLTVLVVNFCHLHSVTHCSLEKVLCLLCSILFHMLVFVFQRSFENWGSLLLLWFCT